MPDDLSQFLAQTKKLQELIVDPVVDAMNERLEFHKLEIKELIQPIAQKQTTLENQQADVSKRLITLEGYKLKATVGWGMYATILAGILSVVGNYLKTKFSSLFH